MRLEKLTFQGILNWQGSITVLLRLLVWSVVYQPNILVADKLQLIFRLEKSRNNPFYNHTLLTCYFNSSLKGTITAKCHEGISNANAICLGRGGQDHPCLSSKFLANLDYKKKSLFQTKHTDTRKHHKLFLYV
jgi:hypothetical protein